MTQKPVRILVADDEQDLLWALKHALSDAGYEVFTASDGVRALSSAQRHRPDLIILDVLMPGLDGLEVCARVRRDPSLAAVPILILTVRDDIEDRVKGLERGGDDYLVKPFDMRELEARVKALLRRGRSGASPASDAEEFLLKAGGLCLDLHRRQVRVGRHTAELTPAEFDILHYLMLHPNEVLSASTLLEAIWGYAFSSESSGLVRWHIRNLRRKIERDPTHPLCICTLPRHGYLFVA